MSREALSTVKLLTPFFIVVGALMGAWFFANVAVATFVWEKLEGPELAIVLSRQAEVPEEIGGYYFGGGAYDLVRAERAYAKAAVLAPDDRDIQYAHSRVLFVEGKFEEAERAINRAIALAPENKRSYYIRGLIHAYNDKLAQAEADFRDFVAWAPREWAGHNDLLFVLSQQKRYEEMKKVGQNALAVVPNGEENPWLLVSLGVAHLNLGENEEALRRFEQAEIAADDLTAADWRRAYPGNNPDTVADGLPAFRAAIAENKRRAERAIELVGSVD